MNACVIKFDNQRLYIDLPVILVHELLADVITRYESFFTFGDPIYPDGQPALLYKVLAEGYGLATCDESVGVEVVDLSALHVEAKAATDDQWKDLHVGRILASTFASTINRS